MNFNLTPVKDRVQQKVDTYDAIVAEENRKGNKVHDLLKEGYDALVAVGVPEEDDFIWMADGAARLGCAGIIFQLKDEHVGVTTHGDVVLVTDRRTNVATTLSPREWYNFSQQVAPGLDSNFRVVLGQYLQCRVEQEAEKKFQKAISQN